MANKIETAGEVFHVLGNISDLLQNQSVCLGFPVSNKKGAHVKALLFWDLSSLLLKHVIIETVGILICFEISYSCDKSTEGFKTFGGVTYVHTLPGGICCASLILFGNEGKNGQW